MKTTRKIMSAACACAILASITGCSNTPESSEPVSTTAPIYVQEDEYQYGENSEGTASDVDEPEEDKPVTSSSSKTESGEKAETQKAHVIAETEVSSFSLPEDKAYNTSMKPNVADDVSFQVELIYTEDFYEAEPKLISSEIMPLTENTTYADICNLTNFSLVTMDGDLSYELDYNGRFDYYGFMHTTANSPATYTLDTDTFNIKPTLNLELVGSDNQIVTDINSLVSTSEDIRVKAISAKTLSTNRDVESQARQTPVMLAFSISLPEHETHTFKVGMPFIQVWSELKDDGIVPAKWTDDLTREDFYIKDVHNNDFLVLKNTDYTIVFVEGGNYIESISLIKN